MTSAALPTVASPQYNPNAAQYLKDMLVLQETNWRTQHFYDLASDHTQSITEMDIAGRPTRLLGASFNDVGGQVQALMVRTDAVANGPAVAYLHLYAVRNGAPVELATGVLSSTDPGFDISHAVFELRHDGPVAYLNTKGVDGTQQPYRLLPIKIIDSSVTPAGLRLLDASFGAQQLQEAALLGQDQLPPQVNTVAFSAHAMNVSQPLPKLDTPAGLWQ